MSESSYNFYKNMQGMQPGYYKGACVNGENQLIGAYFLPISNKPARCLDEVLPLSIFDGTVVHWSGESGEVISIPPAALVVMQE